MDEALSHHHYILSYALGAAQEPVRPSNEPPVNLGWLYTPLPWDYDLTPIDPSYGKPTTLRPPWMPDPFSASGAAVDSVWSSPANPPPRLLTVIPGWRYSMFLVNDEDNLQVVFQIVNVTWTDAGEYTCYCSETFPPVALADHTLVVYGRPLVFAFSSTATYSVPLQNGRMLVDGKSQRIGATTSEQIASQSLTIASGSNVTLTCLYSSSVLPVRRFIWLRNGTQIYVSTDANDAALRLHKVTAKEDGGDYTCRVDLALVVNATSAPARLHIVDGLEHGQGKTRKNFEIYVFILFPFHFQDGDDPELAAQHESNASVATAKENTNLMIIIAVLASLLFVMVVLTVVAVLVLHEHYRRREVF